LTLVTAALHRWAPNWVARLSWWSSAAATRPGLYFVGILIASILAYVPMALAFTPWAWSERGPLALQFSRPMLYAVFYFAGLGVGAYGLERGLLNPIGSLARSWAAWCSGALGSFLLWLGLTALAMRYALVPLPALEIATDASFALACGCGCFSAMAGCLRFATHRSRIFESLARNAFGIYLLHYVFVVWLQYALLGLALFAIAKALAVFLGALGLAWAATIAMGFVPFGWRLIGAEQRRSSLGISRSEVSCR
jgi:glucan biosynthesis protein C